MRFWDLFESERLVWESQATAFVILRKKHPKLCCGSQQEGPRTVEEDASPSLTTWRRTLVWNQFQKSKLKWWTRQHGGNLSTRLGRISGWDRLGVKETACWGPCPQNKTLVHFRVSLKKIRWAPLSLLYGYPPPPPPPGFKLWFITEIENGHLQNLMQTLKGDLPDSVSCLCQVM